MQTSKAKRKYVELVLVGLLVTTLVPVAIGHSQGNEGLFERIAGQAKGKVDELIDLIEEAAGITWPGDFPTEIVDLYDEAVFDLGEEEYKDAMIAFRNVFKELNIYVEAEGYTFERGVGVEAQGMFIAIARARERIARITDVVASIVADDPDAPVSTVETLLGEAEGCLVEAEGLIPTDRTAAASKIEEANEKISEAFVALKEVAGWLNSWRVESFLQGVKKSILRARELLERTGFDGDLTEDLEAIAANIDLARDAMPDIKEAISKLRDLREGLRDFHREIASRRKEGHSPPGNHPQGPPGS